MFLVFGIPWAGLNIQNCISRCFSYTIPSRVLYYFSCSFRRCPGNFYGCTCLAHHGKRQPKKVAGRCPLLVRSIALNRSSSFPTRDRDVKLQTLFQRLLLFYDCFSQWFHAIARRCSSSSLVVEVPWTVLQGFLQFVSW